MGVLLFYLKQMSEQLSLHELHQWLQRYGPVGQAGDKTVMVRKADGVWLETQEGKRLLDFSAGGLIPMGYSYPGLPGAPGQPEQGWVGPGTERAERVFLMHKLAEIVPGGMNRRVLLCDSGREALARAVVLATNASGRKKVAYLAEVPGDGVSFGSDVGAVVVHPFDSRVGQAAEFCRKNDALLIDDETMMAPGMSGKMFAIEWAGVRPDVYVLGRGLAMGLAFGACVTGSSALRWDRNSTGGSPAGCAVALEFIELLESGFLKKASIMGAYLQDRLAGFAGSGIAEQVLGIGFVLSLRFGSAGMAAGFAAGCQDRGLLLSSVGKRTVGVWPPLVVKKEEIDQAVEIMKRVLARLGNG